MHKNAIHLLVAGALLAGAAAGEAQREVRVRETAGGPMIHVDGKAVPPRMFWGRSGSRRYKIGTDWTPFTLTFTAPADTARGTVHLRFHKPQSARAQLRNFSLLEDGKPFQTGMEHAFDGDAEFAQTWKIWPPKSDYVHTVSGGVCTVELHPWRLPGPDPDYHFYTKFLRFRKGAVYTLRFEARGDGCTWILPGVYDVGPSGVHAQIPLTTGAEMSDTFLSTVRKAADAGVDFVSYGIPEVWREDGDDFTAFDALTDSIIRTNPNAFLIPRVSVNAPKWWLDKNPEHRMQYAQEHVNVKGRGVWGRGLRPDMATVSSRPYRAAAVAYITRFARHMMERYPRNFAGIHPTGQNTSEWFYFDSWNKMNGYDPQTLAAFRAWTGDPAAEVPPVSARLAGENERHLLDPVTQRRCIEFNRFQQQEMTDFVAELARACRAATEGQKLVVFFYGYAWEFASHRYGPANSGHYGMENLLKKADGSIDILCSPISYFDRAFCGSAPNMSAGETVMRNGILWLNEDDTRTHLDHRSEAYVQEGTLVTLPQSRSVMLRNTAQEAIRGFGSWWMDLPGMGWYDSAELWDVQRGLMPLEHKMLARTAPFTPEIALIQDEESMIQVAGKAHVVNGKLVSQVRGTVNRCGAPHGQYLLFDVCRKPLAAKLQVFQSCWSLSDAKIDALVRQRETHPATRVWCWAPGWRDNEGVPDLARMTRLTGFRFKPLAKPVDQALFTVTDAKPEEVLERFPDGSPSVVVRRRGAGADVFVSKPDLTAPLLHRLAALAGVHLYLPADEVGKATLWATRIRDDAYVLEVQAMEDTTLHLRIPSVQPIRDAISGQPLGQGPVLPLKLAKGETRVLIAE